MAASYQNGCLSSMKSTSTKKVIFLSNISKEIKGQEKAMGPSETSDTFAVLQTLLFLLDWTN